MGLKEIEDKKNGGAMCSYYGSLDYSVKPRYGVHYFLLDEYMKKTMEKLEEKATAHFHKMNENVRRSSMTELRILKETVDTLKDDVRELSLLIKRIATDNDLKMPKTIVVKKLKKSIQPKIEEDVQDDGEE